MARTIAGAATNGDSFSVFIEIDSGAGRAGLPFPELPGLLDIARVLHDAPGVDLAGVQPQQLEQAGEGLLVRLRHLVVCDQVAQVHPGLGVGDLGLISRGEDVEITTYLETAMRSELQGNVVDLCPVGALGSKDFLYSQRVWYLKESDGVCSLCSTGCSTHVDTNKDMVYRLRGRDYDVGLHALTNVTPKGSKRGPLARLLRQLRLSWDDFAISPIGAAERNDLLEVLDDRVGERSVSMPLGALPVLSMLAEGQNEARRRIDAIFSSTREILSKYLSTRPITDLQAEVDAAANAPQTSAEETPEAPADDATPTS